MARTRETDKWDIVHVSAGLGFALFGYLSLRCGWCGRFSGAAVCLVDLYLVAVLLEAAQRRSDKHKFLQFPHRSWSILFVFLLLASLVFSFGNMYIKTGGVRHQVADLPDSATKTVQETSTGCGPAEILTHWGDAAYFSAVTMTTLGYGDYMPVNRRARMVVIWQLASGFLVLLLVLPVLASRLADWQQRTEPKL